MSKTTSPSLLLRIRNPDDESAWREFDELYSEIIRLYCRQRKLQPHDEDDVVQEVMDSVCKAIRTFEYDPSKGRFRSWLGTVTANRIRNHLSRKSGSDVVAVGGDAVDNANGNWVDPDDSWVEIFSERIFRKACSLVRPNVSETTWACFEATWIMEEEAGEVAKRFDIPVHSVYVNKSRVLKRLDQQIRVLAEDLPVAKENTEKSDK